jgi:hypothetical protein
MKLSDALKGPADRYRSAIEREEDALSEQLANGDISPTEYNREMRELQRDYRDAAEESARNAYEQERERW